MNGQKIGTDVAQPIMDRVFAKYTIHLTKVEPKIKDHDFFGTIL